MWMRSIAAALVLSAVAVTSQAQVIDKKGLTLDGAMKVIAAAVAEAKRVNAPGGVIAAVDEGGNLRAMSAMAASMPVTYIESKKVSAAFAKGMPLLEVDQYKVHASRRTEPGVVEVHNWETDVVYVLEGSATLVTGGTMVDPKTIGPGQIRSPSLQRGESRRITTGDESPRPHNPPA